MNRKHSQNLFFAVAIGILSTSWLGCSRVPDGPRTVPAEGIITLDGEPISGAAIVFISDGGDVSANGISGPDGEFSLDAFPYKKGAVPGPYKCIVTRTVEITTNSAEMKFGKRCMTSDQTTCLTTSSMCSRGLLTIPWKKGS